MAPLPVNAGPRDLALGAVVQMAEAATLGLPFEVWKTRCGRFRNESTMEALVNVYRRGGLGAFWQGMSPKLVESASKGAVLLYSKEMIRAACIGSGMDRTLSGFVAGAGGGVCQVSVMGPCTFLVTAVVTGKTGVSPIQAAKETWARAGLRGFYPGASAIAFRQATNWASRQGFTDAARAGMRKVFHNGNPDARLTPTQQILSGTIGGAVSCWNMPFEVARIEMQSRASEGQKKMGLAETMRQVVQESGVRGLFRGLIPRMMLGVYQTLFMITLAGEIKERLG